MSQDNWKFEKDYNLFKQYHLSLQLIIKLLLLLFVTLNLNLAIAQTQKVEDVVLDGYQVKFDYKGYQVEREKVYQYYLNQNIKDKFYSLQKSDIGIDLYDIDNDGNKEVLIYLFNSGYCGSAGCSFKILKVSNNGNIEVKLSVTVSDDIKILTSSNLKYQDILLNGNRVWRWNGTRYNLYNFKNQKVSNKFSDRYDVMFDYTNHKEEREIAYQYYLDHESQYISGLTKEQIGIDLYDIDNDGEPEILVYVNAEDRCPRPGCHFTTLKKIKNNKYKIIPWSMENGEGILTDEAPKILNSSTLGYHDITFDISKKPKRIFKWNGKYYD